MSDLETTVMLSVEPFEASEAPATPQYFDPETYIEAGDQIIAVSHDINGELIRGLVLAVGTGEPGAREVIIQQDGTDSKDQGALGVSERHFTFEIKKPGADSWVLVPSRLCREDADAKAVRARLSEERRILKKAPLFANQIMPQTMSAEDFQMSWKDKADWLFQRRVGDASEATRLQGVAKSLVGDDVEFEKLTRWRAVYPKNGSNGKWFWKRLLERYETAESRSKTVVEVMAQVTEKRQKLEVAKAELAAYQSGDKKKLGPVDVDAKGLLESIIRVLQYDLDQLEPQIALAVGIEARTKLFSMWEDLDGNSSIAPASFHQHSNIADAAAEFFR